MSHPGTKNKIKKYGIRFSVTLMLFLFCYVSVMYGGVLLLINRHGLLHFLLHWVLSATGFKNPAVSMMQKNLSELKKPWTPSPIRQFPVSDVLSIESRWSSITMIPTAPATKMKITSFRIKLRFLRVVSDRASSKWSAFTSIVSSRIVMRITIMTLIPAWLYLPGQKGLPVPSLKPGISPISPAPKKMTAQ